MSFAYDYWWLSIIGAVVVLVGCRSRSGSRSGSRGAGRILDLAANDVPSIGMMIGLAHSLTTVTVSFNI